jgi:hypothetical protein
MSEEESSQPEEQVDIEAIMQQIREQILAREAASRPGGQAPVKITGKRFSPEFYEHLYHAGLAYDKIQVKMFVSQSTVPLIGPILQWLRGKLHELVLFYVNQLAAQQITFNTHLLRAVSIMAEDLEASANGEEADSA